MREILIEENTMVSHIGVERFRIDEISDKELLGEFPFSKIYKVNINGQDLLYKIIYKNTHMDFDKVLRSYNNQKHYNDIEALVKIYDFRKADDNSTFEVLMEQLKGYQPVENVVKEKKLDHAKQIYTIFSQLLNKGLVPVDSGIANFLTDGTNVKMIDLDFMLFWKECYFHYTSWFITRIQQFKDWCPQISIPMDCLIKKVLAERDKYFNPYNPLAQKYLEKGEEILAKKGIPNTAIKFFNKALTENPNLADAHNNLAVAYWQLNNEEKSVESIKTAIEIEPLNETFVNNYIDILSAKQKTTEAIEVFNKYESLVKSVSGYNSNLLDEKFTEEYLDELQKEITEYTYPQNYTYNIKTLQPTGQLVKRVEYFLKYCPEIFGKCENFLSVGSSLGYMLLYHSYHAKKCTGIEPDEKAHDILRRVTDYRDIDNIVLHKGTFLDFPKNELYDLIWMGNVFHYMYLDFEWGVAQELAKISNGTCVIEAPLEGTFLQTQIQFNSNWSNDRLMNAYSFTRFEKEMGKYFDVVSVNPSGTDPVNRVIVVIKRNGVTV